MAFVKSPSSQSSLRSSLSAPYLALVAICVATLLSAYYFYSAGTVNDQLRFENQIQQTQDSISARLETYISTLRGVSGLLAASPNLDRAAFRAYVERLQVATYYPGIQGIGYSLRVAPAERAALEQRMRAQGFPNFQIWPDDQRAEYHAIIYLEPQDRRNQQALGFDMFSEPTRRAAMERARDTALPPASGEALLLQEIDASKQPGFLIYTPVYRGGQLPATVDARRAALLGFAYSPFRVNDLLAGILSNQGQPEIAFQIYDGAVQPEHMLFRSSDTPDHADMLTSMRTLAVAGREWQILYTTLPSFRDSPTRLIAPFILLTGALGAVALFLVMRGQERARAQAEEAVRVRDVFLSVASHELKSPLTALLGHTQLMLRRGSREGATERDLRTLQIIAQQAERLNKLITMLLDHSRIATGHLLIERRPVDLAALLRQVLEEIRPTLTQHTLVADLPAAMLVIDGDELRLEQVILNIVNNAVKYSPQGGSVEVRLAYQERDALLSVTDHGIGIPESALPHLFEQFYRAPNVHSQGISGLGIGLHLSREVVRQHGGTIAVASCEGTGTTITIRLPLKPEWLPAEEPATAGVAR